MRGWTQRTTLSLQVLRCKPAVLLTASSSEVLADLSSLCRLHGYVEHGRTDVTDGLSGRLEVYNSAGKISRKRVICLKAENERQATSRDRSTAIELDFSKPFQRLDYLQAIEEAVGQKLPDPSELETEESLKLLRNTETRLQINQPLCMSPLAKEHREKAGVSERFELFILGREVANAYTELNDPREQKKRYVLLS
eukprot:763636-Hanusia_phi.AAC.2